MKKSTRLLTVLLLLCALVLSGCGETDVPIIDEAPPSVIALTEDEITLVNEAFTLVSDAGEVNAICCFFTSFYERPEDIDLEAFLRYCPVGEQLDDADAEECAAYLAEAGIGTENWKDKLPSELPLPVHRKPKEDVSAVLMKYADITTDDLAKTDGVVYLEAYDAFYNTTSDFGLDTFPCVGGEKTEDTVRLWSETDENGYRTELTLRAVNETYYIRSFLQVKV